MIWLLTISRAAGTYRAAGISRPMDISRIRQDPYRCRAGGATKGGTENELQKIEGFHIPVVALTANAIAVIREKYIAEGFVDYLAKPIEKEEVFRVFHQVIDKDIYKKDETKEEEKEYTTYTFVNGKLIKDE